MGLLNKHFVYLSGPIDCIDWNEAIDWRNKITNMLSSFNLNILDPCNKKTTHASEIDKRVLRKQYIQEGKLTEAAGIMKEIIRYDMRMIDKSDFVICYVNKSVHMCGTYFEIAHALIQRKPILCIIAGGLTQVPDWLLGIISPQYMFSSLEEVITYLNKIDENKLTPLDIKHWRFFNYE